MANEPRVVVLMNGCLRDKKSHLNLTYIYKIRYIDEENTRAKESRNGQGRN